mgnify:CR=1 FL=1|jgi:hypothetical protein
MARGRGAGGAPVAGGAVTDDPPADRAEAQTDLSEECDLCVPVMTYVC